MESNKSHFLILSLAFACTFLLSEATYGSGKFQSSITQADSIVVLEIVVNEGFRDGEYMKIALQDGEDSEKVIFEGKIKRKPDDYHYRVTFKTPIAKNEYDIIKVTTGAKKETHAYIGIKVTKGNYCELNICKWPNCNDILLMVSDTPGMYD